jgi:UDP-glucose 4-epimerase
MANSSKLCLVTGASGVVGVPLVFELLKQGHRIRVLVRKVSNEFPSEVEQIIGDILDEKILELATTNCNWIFHLAAKLHVNNPGENLESEYRKTNLDATVNLLKYSRKAEKFIFFSTINVYGSTQDDRIATELDQIAPIGLYSKYKAEGEKFVIASHNGIVLRLSAVYGSRMKGNYLSVLALIKKGIFVLIGDGNNRRTIIHHNDVARAAIFLAASNSNIGEIYNVSDNEIHRFRDIVSAMYLALGKKPRKLSVPLALTKTLLSFTDKVSFAFRIKLPFSSNLLEKLIEDMAVSSAKLHNLGFVPEFNLEKGWREVIENR